MEDKISAGTIARTVALLVTIINSILTMMGKNPLPFSETEIYEWVTGIAVIVTALIAWWKNNSFTSEAIRADKLKDELKELKEETS